MRGKQPFGLSRRRTNAPDCTRQFSDEHNGSSKVVHLTSAHRADDPRIFYKECQSLAKAGYSVTLIASDQQNDLITGVNIQAVPLRRSRLLRMTLSVWNVYHEALRQRADIYHFHDPELIPAGIALKLHGKVVVYDVHEDLPLQVLTKPWIPRVLRPLVATFSVVIDQIAGSVFDGIVAATPKIAARFPRKNAVAVQNFPLLEESTSANAEAYRERAPQIVYIGIVSRIRGVMEMIEAVQRVPPSLGAHLSIVGPFDSPRIKSELQHLSLPTVELLGYQSSIAVRQVLGKSRIGLVLLHPMVNYMDAVPTKLFEYMSAGLPVVASDFPLWRKIIEEARCGLLVDPLDSCAIARAIQQLLENPDEAEQMGKRGRQLAQERFNWKTERLALLQLYDHLAKPVA